MTDLTALVLTIAPSKPAELPATLGRANYAQFLDLINQSDSDLAETLHSLKANKPFTCSNVIGGHRVENHQRRYLPEKPAWIRYTGLNEQVSSHLHRWAENPPPFVTFADQQFEVLSATLDPAEHQWAGSSSYETVATPYLLAKKQPDFRIALNFASPTGFRKGSVEKLKIIHPIPMGDWVFGSLLNRWNTHSPVTLASEVRRFAEECIVLSRYQLSTRAVHAKNTVHTGCVGEANFAILVKDRFWASMLNLLADYSFFSGVGYQTTTGMGQVHRIFKDELQMVEAENKEEKTA